MPENTKIGPNGMHAVNPCVHCWCVFATLESKRGEGPALSGFIIGRHSKIEMAIEFQDGIVIYHSCGTKHVVPFRGKPTKNERSEREMKDGAGYVEEIEEWQHTNSLWTGSSCRLLLLVCLCVLEAMMSSIFIYLQIHTLHEQTAKMYNQEFRLLLFTQS